MGKCGIFFDDIVILGRGFEDHMKNMEQVLGLFQDFKLKLKPSTCVLLKRDICFLGHKQGTKWITGQYSLLRTSALTWVLDQSILRVASACFKIKLIAFLLSLGRRRLRLWPGRGKMGVGMRVLIKDCKLWGV